MQRNKATTFNFIIALMLAALSLNSCLIDLEGRPDQERTNFKSKVKPMEGDPEPEITPEVETRPTGEIFIKNDYCVCLNGKNDTLKNCDSFCADKTDTKATVYLNFDISANVQNRFGSAQQWCSTEIAGVVNPTCQLKVESESGTTNSTEPTFFNDGNSVKFDVSNVTDYGKIYKLSLIEVTSGALSSVVQVSRKPADSEFEQLPLLPFTPISQYSCLDLKGLTLNSDNFYNFASRVHFYFPSNNEPTPMPPGSDFRVCHDRRIYGDNDSPKTPRFELTPSNWRFHVWSSSDPRFFDTDSTGVMDINEIISNELSTRFDQNVDGNQEFFTEFNWFTSPAEVASERLGFVLQPFVEQINENGILRTKVVCPGEQEYADTTKPLYQLLGELISVDTEALYIAEKQPEFVTDENGNQVLDDSNNPQLASPDYIFIRENLLRKIWFYYENGQLKTPTADLATQKTIRFHWPPSTNPTQFQAHQKVYTVKSFSDLSADNQSSIGLRTNFPPPDKRIGCIPNLLGEGDVTGPQ